MAICLTACSGSKDMAEGKDSTEDDLEIVPVMNSIDYITGTVTTKYADQDCKYLIQVQGKGDEMLIHPMNLPKKYQKDGAQISFTWVASKSPQTNNCTLGIWSTITVEE